MPDARHTTSSLIARFLLKKVAVFVLIVLALTLYKGHPLVYGVGWLVVMFLVWCVLSVAELYGDIWAYSDLRESLASGRDPELLIEPWMQRDSTLAKFDALLILILAVGAFLVGFSIWIVILGFLVGAYHLLPVMVEADPRDLEEMIVR